MQNMAAKKRIVVIGAGVSGLLAIKSLKEEGFEPICFEKTSRIGGLWHYHEDDVIGVPSAMWSTTLNNSKEPGAISDFPAKPEYPNFMPHSKVFELFQDYAAKFDLLRHINYHKEVIKVKRTDDFDATGRWIVGIKDVETGNCNDDVYGGVLVCTGYLNIENIPTFPGQTCFKGPFIHTHGVKRFSQFENKIVCVIGGGNAALDAAVEISHTAKQVYLSIRTPPWIYTRQGPYGYPIDCGFFSYLYPLLQKALPLRWCDKLMQDILINPRFSHKFYDINPKGFVSRRYPVVSDGISNRLLNGTIIMKNNITCFAEDGVIFDGEGTHVTAVDTVVFGTGYQWDFPFLDSKDFIVEGNKVLLYKCVFPLHLSYPTLGIIGFILPMGPFIPCVEMQCRWAARILKGKCELPTYTNMIRAVEKQFAGNLKRYGDSDKVYIHITPVKYLDNLASKIGAKPNILRLLLTDYNLFLACVFGTPLPYKYRLTGPHKWNGARNAILTANARIRAPLLKSGVVRNTMVKRRFHKRYVLLLLFVVGLYMWKKNVFRYERYKCIMQYIFVIRYLINHPRTAWEIGLQHFWK